MNKIVTQTKDARAAQKNTQKEHLMSDFCVKSSGFINRGSHHFEEVVRLLTEFDEKIAAVHSAIRSEALSGLGVVLRWYRLRIDNDCAAR